MKRRYLVLLLVALIAAVLPLAGIAASSAISGDVNLDGRITDADLQRLNEHLTGIWELTGQGLLNADLNKDGSITGTDATLLNQKITGGKVSTLAGDVNLDGKITNTDLQQLKEYITGTRELTVQGLANADLNKDGSISATDVTLLKQKITGSQTTKPTITTQPKSVTVNAGKTATFKVVASGATSYQWYYRTSSKGSWNKCSGSTATTAARSIATKAGYNGYQYRCLVKNKAGSVSSSIVTLTVKSKPTVTAQPKSVTVSEGGKATFKVTAKGASSYQWYCRKSPDATWRKCSGTAATKASFSLSATVGRNGYQYRCLVKNSAGSVYSKAATLTVRAKPIVTTQPGSVTVSVGRKATFKVEAVYASSYQWYYRKSSSGVWQKCTSGSVTSAAYSFTAKAAHNGYQYRCLVKNSVGSVYTNTVTLKVR